MLLAIASKMSKEGLLTKPQRGTNNIYIYIYIYRKPKRPYIRP